MTSRYISFVTDADLEAVLPIQRVRSSCNVSNNFSDNRLIQYRMAAYNDACHIARSTLLPQTVEATFLVPFATTRGFGLETSFSDLDGIDNAFRLPLGPVSGVTSINYVNASGVLSDAINVSDYTVEPDRFIRWRDGYEFLNAGDRPQVRIVYNAGFPANHPLLSAALLAVEEITMAKWDARGGSYLLPSTARNALFALRTSRTYVPGAR